MEIEQMKTYKRLGSAVWAISYFTFLWTAVAWSNIGLAGICIMVVALVFYMPMLLFNWLFGQQKGHLVHFYAILISLPFAVAMRFRDEIGTVTYGLVVVAFCAAGYFLAQKYRPGFVNDAKRRIARDHFTGEQRPY